MVEYLRTIYVPIRHATLQAMSNDDLSPLLQVDELQTAGPQCVRLLWTGTGPRVRWSPC